MENLILKNDANVDEAFVSKIIGQAGLNKGKILLRLMDGYLPDNTAGNTLPRSLLKYAQDFHIFDNYLDLDWEIGIAISKRYCLSYNSYPAYFSYLLGHELGHATVCVNDLDLHVFYCLIQEHIKHASEGNISSWHELPHEIIFDQFGLYIAEMLFGRERIDHEIRLLLGDHSREDLARLKLMLSLRGSKDLGRLWVDLLDFTKPYKGKLIESWEESVLVLGDGSLASYFDNINHLFD
ncbi:MAG: hypothetical protein JRJ50_12505 [Deltaproteobacteria bacterium]|nr:hypothetical protein [Deltaproteobacteria bacterium]MBW2035696.1 hypothetical protein [Deltaproteobacteria bacterium]MBW2115686.1 hypothetical protein [Deltaproteobacteria bacterium]